MDITKLIVMQNDVRNPNQLPSMSLHVGLGGLWKADEIHRYSSAQGLRSAPIIELATFPDGKIMVHDGHHRCVATYIAGRKILMPEEYKVVNWKYEDYTNINFDAKWVTPFDPRTHIRIANIAEFKGRVLELAKESKEAAIDYILKNRGLYLVERDIHTVPELVQKCIERFKNEQRS